MDEVGKLVRGAGRRGRGQHGRLRVGIVSSIAGGTARELLRVYVERHPEVDLAIIEGSPREHIVEVRMLRIGAMLVVDTPQHHAVAPGRAEALLDALVMATQETLQFVPGFVSANFHVSLDGSSLVNYAQWRDADAIKAAGADPEVAARIQRVAQITQSFTPVLYEVRRSVSAASKSIGEVA